MKKILVLAIAMATGVIANAANIAWGNFYGTYEDKNGETFAGGTALIYVLTGDASTGVVFDNGKWNLNGATLVATSAYSADDEGWGAMDFVQTSVVAVNNITSDKQEMQYFTTLIVDKAGVTAIDTYEGAFVSFTEQGRLAVVDPTAPTYGVDASMYNDIAKGDWQTASAVPEPTSGLLLLLGMAGLALRRRRA